MFRINGPGHVANMWVDKDPGMGIPGTTFIAAWQNTIQEELAGVVEASGLTLSESLDNQLLAAILTLGASVENRVLNGLMEIWGPAGPGPSSVHDIVAADGDKVFAEPFGCNVGDSPGAASITRGTFAFGTIPPGMAKLGQPRNYMNWDQTVGATSSVPMIQQAIESVKTFAGLEVTFSCVARVVSGTLTVTPRLKQDFGTGGTPTADKFYTGTAWTFTTSWQRFSYTVTLDDIGGTTLGTSTDVDGHSFLEVRMAFPISSTFEVQVSDVRLDPGSQALALWRSPHAEHRLTMRYFESSWARDQPIGTLTSSAVLGNFLFVTNAYLGQTIPFRVRKYGTPLFHCYSHQTTTSEDTCRLIEDGSTRDVAVGGPPNEYQSGLLRIDAGETQTSAQETWGLHWYAAVFPDIGYTIPL